MKNVLAVILVGIIGFGAWLVFHETAPKKTKHHAAAETADDDPPPPAEPQAAATPDPTPEALDQARLRAIAAAAHRAAASRGSSPLVVARDSVGSDNSAVGFPGGSPPPPPKKKDGLQIVEPDENATDPADKTARAAAETYKAVVGAMHLLPEQEDKFKQTLYDTKIAYQNAIKDADSKAFGDNMDPEARNNALAQANDAKKKAWEDQKLVADDALKEIFDDKQFQIYSTIVQNPLFMANGLRFKPPDPAQAQQP